MIQFKFVFLCVLCFTSFSVLAIDCDMPQTVLSQIICDDYRLSQANKRLEQLYQQQLKISESDKTQNTQWLASLEQHCEIKNKDCLRQQYEQRIRELSQKTWAFQAQIHPNIPQLQFKLIGIADEDTAHIQKLTISNQDGQILQTLVVADVSDMLKETETLWLDNGEGFKIEDVNFDGYSDIRLMELLPAGANVPYLYWLYDPEQKQFVFNRRFSDLAHLTLDLNKKWVVSQYQISAVEHGTDYYKVDKHQLILIRQKLTQYVKNDEDERVLFELVKELVDNKLKVVSQKPIE
ncbi:MAG: hypothetical protein VSS52_011615 [Thiotrichaceae bacterium]|nr:hypothetical protein [Thiotrichaceae bacterium]